MLAFIASEAREFAGLLRLAERVARMDWPLDFARTASLTGRAVVLAANGPGPGLAQKAAEVVREHHDLEGLVSIGFCGALNPALKTGDILVASELHGVAHALSVPRSHSCERSGGKLLSLDRVVATAQEKSSLRETTGADAVEMEAAGLAEKAQQWNIPFYAVKVVTDTAAESFPLDFNLFRDRQGRFSRAKVLSAALRRPTVFPALLNLNRKCNLAAQTLGDFLADARF